MRLTGSGGRSIYSQRLVDNLFVLVFYVGHATGALINLNFNSMSLFSHPLLYVSNFLSTRFKLHPEGTKLIQFWLNVALPNFINYAPTCRTKGSNKSTFCSQQHPRFSNRSHSSLRIMRQRSLRVNCQWPKNGQSLRGVFARVHWIPKVITA